MPTIVITATNQTSSLRCISANKTDAQDGDGTLSAAAWNLAGWGYSTPQYRALQYHHNFDLSSIPVGSRIISASLGLTQTSTVWVDTDSYSPNWGIILGAWDGAASITTGDWADQLAASAAIDSITTSSVGGDTVKSFTGAGIRANVQTYVSLGLPWIDFVSAGYEAIGAAPPTPTALNQFSISSTQSSHSLTVVYEDGGLVMGVNF